MSVEAEGREVLSRLLAVRDDDGRQRAELFVKLPSRKLFADYYKVISEPMAVDTIQKKLNAGEYDSFAAFEADVAVMFANAKYYNEPGSEVYEDAVALEKAFKAAKKEVHTSNKRGDTPSSTPSRSAVKKEAATPATPKAGSAADRAQLEGILEEITALKGDDGRQLAKEFLKLPSRKEFAIYYTVVEKPISLSEIRSNISKGEIASVAALAAAVDLMVKNAKMFNEPDSEIVSDALTISKTVAKHLPRKGRGTPAAPEAPSIPAPAATPSRAKPAAKSASPAPAKAAAPSFADYVPEQTEESVTVGDASFRAGEVVLLPNTVDAEAAPHVVLLDAVWMENGAPMCHGTLLFRPEETFHVATKRFFENEVFRTNAGRTLPLTGVVGKGAVISAKDFPKLRPEGIADANVFVCESRYVEASKTFHRIKDWRKAFPHPDAAPALVTRDVPVELTTVRSVFWTDAEGDGDGDEGAVADADDDAMDVDAPVVKPKRKAPATPSSPSTLDLDASASAAKTPRTAAAKDVKTRKPVQISTNVSYGWSSRDSLRREIYLARQTPVPESKSLDRAHLYVCFLGADPLAVEVPGGVALGRICVPHLLRALSFPKNRRQLLLKRVSAAYPEHIVETQADLDRSGLWAPLELVCAVLQDELSASQTDLMATFAPIVRSYPQFVAREPSLAIPFLDDGLLGNGEAIPALVESEPAGDGTAAPARPPLQATLPPYTPLTVSLPRGGPIVGGPVTTAASSSAPLPQLQLSARGTQALVARALAGELSSNAVQPSSSPLGIWLFHSDSDGTVWPLDPAVEAHSITVHVDRRPGAQTTNTHAVANSDDEQAGASASKPTLTLVIATNGAVSEVQAFWNAKPITPTLVEKPPSPVAASVGATLGRYPAVQTAFYTATVDIVGPLSLFELVLGGAEQQQRPFYTIFVRKAAAV